MERFLRGLAQDDLKGMTTQEGNLPVIIISSKEDEIDTLRALRMGVDDYLRTLCPQLMMLERI